MDLSNSLYIAAAGMKAQGERLRVVSENIANSESAGDTPGANPYRRKTVSFQNVLDRELGFDKVQISKFGNDESSFIKKYDPYHPAADKDGYVLMPNVNPMVEMMDMREARLGYEANMNVVEVTKGMLMQTINMLKN